MKNNISADDLKLLFLAAWDSGRTVYDYQFGKLVCHGGELWNPLNDLADAFKLAADFQMDLFLGHGGARVRFSNNEFQELCQVDSGENLKCACRAIVRAAASCTDASVLRGDEFGKLLAKVYG